MTKNKMIEMVNKDGKLLALFTGLLLDGLPIFLLGQVPLLLRLEIERLPEMILLGSGLCLRFDCARRLRTASTKYW